MIFLLTQMGGFSWDPQFLSLNRMKGSSGKPYWCYIVGGSHGLPKSIFPSNISSQIGLDGATPSHHGVSEQSRAQVWEPCSERQLLRLPQSSSLVVTVPAIESIKDRS